MTVLCGLGFVMSPPLDAAVEAGCVAEMAGEAVGKGIKKEVDKKYGKLPSHSSGSSVGGAGGDLPKMLQRGGPSLQKAESWGLKGSKFASKIHIKRGQTSEGQDVV